MNRILTAILTMLWIMPLHVNAETVDEQQLKAAYVYNFVKFVSWPEEALSAGHGKIQLCSVSEAPLDGALDVLQDQIAQELPVNVTGPRQQKQDGMSWTDCHVLYIAEQDEEEFLSRASELGEHPVLLVGETEEFLESGGMIRFLKVGLKIRFSVNLAAVQQQQLSVSSFLLKLAVDVHH